MAAVKRLAPFGPFLLAVLWGYGAALGIHAQSVVAEGGGLPALPMGPPTSVQPPNAFSYSEGAKQEPGAAEQPFLSSRAPSSRPMPEFLLFWDIPGQSAGLAPTTLPNRFPHFQAKEWWRSPVLAADAWDRQPSSNNPAKSPGWQVEEGLPLPLPGQVFVFGQLGGEEDKPAARDLRLKGRTGVGWKVPLSPEAEVLFRSGPALGSTDPLHPSRVLEEAHLQLEMQCRWRLLGWAELEYQGVASPFLNAGERGRLDQDLGFTLPLGKAGQLRLGTKHSWESAPSWTDSLRFQLGSSLKW